MKDAAIFDGIREIYQQQILAAENKTDEEVARIEADSAQKILSLRKKMLEEVRRRFSREHANIKQQTEIQKLKIIADARQALIDEVLDQVAVGFKNFRQEIRYQDVFNIMVDEAIYLLKPSLLINQGITLFIDSRDRNLIAKYENKSNHSMEINDSLTCWGGCIAESADGLVSVKNTLESRLEHSLPQLNRRLNLFFNQFFNHL